MQSEWCHPSLTGTAPSWEITNHRSFKQGQGLDSAPGTGDRATLAVCMDWGMRLDSSCGKGLGFWWMARWIWVSGVLAARRAQPCPREPLKAGDRPALLWPGAPHPSAGGRLGHHETRKTLSFRQSSKEAMRIVKGLEGKPYGELLRSFDLFSLEDTEETSLQSTTSLWRGGEEQTLISSLLWPVAEPRGTTRAESGQVDVGYQETFSPREWLSTGQTCQEVLTRVQEGFGQYSWANGVNLGDDQD